MSDNDYHTISEADYNKAWDNIKWLMLYRRNKTIELLMVMVAASWWI